MTPAIETVSQSQINGWEKCGQVDAYKSDGIPAPPGVAALRGTAVHVAADHNHQAKIKTGRDLDENYLVEVAAHAFDDRRADSGVMLTPDEQVTGLRPSLARGKMAALDLTRLWRREVAPTYQPVFSEKTITAKVEGFPVLLKGRIDTFTTERRHKDLKTTGGSFSQRQADESHQATLYDLLILAETGSVAAGHDFEVLNATTIKHTTLRTERSAPDYLALRNRIVAMLKAKKYGVIHPAPLGSWWCSPTWCGYWNICPFVNSERKAAAGI